MTASKVYEMGGLYKKPFDRPQSYTVLARIACNGRYGGARSTAWTNSPVISENLGTSDGRSLIRRLRLALYV